MKFLKKGLAVLFACTFVSVPLYHPVEADAVSMDDMGDMNEDQEVSVSDAVEILTIYAKSAAGLYSSYSSPAPVSFPPFSGSSTSTDGLNPVAASYVGSGWCPCPAVSCSGASACCVKGGITR